MTLCVSRVFSLSIATALSLFHLDIDSDRVIFVLSRHRWRYLCSVLISITTPLSLFCLELLCRLSQQCVKIEVGVRLLRYDGAHFLFILHIAIWNKTRVVETLIVHSTGFPPGKPISGRKWNNPEKIKKATYRNENGKIKISYDRSLRNLTIKMVHSAGFWTNYSSTCHERTPSGPGKSVLSLQVAADQR